MKPEVLEAFKTMASDNKAEAAEARQAFAAEVQVPLGQSVAAESTIRVIYDVDPLEPGQQANYPKEAGQIEAIVLPGRAAVPQNIIVGDELFIPTFTIASSAEWELKYARDGRFNVADRQLARLKDAIVREERKEGWRVIRAAIDATKYENSINDGATELDKEFLNTLVTDFNAREDYRADLLVISPKTAGDIRAWDDTDVDPQTRREIWQNAGLGNVWGIDIMQDFELGDDEVYLFDTSRFGKMPVRQEVALEEDASAIRFLRVRFIGWEEVGFAAADPKAVYKGTITRGGE